MKKYDSLQEMYDDLAPAFVIEQVEALIKGTTAEVEGVPKITRAPHEPEVGTNFEYWYGGSINIVETVEDLKEISVLVDSEINPGEYATLYEAASTADQAFYFPGREWVMFWIATNNNGGPSYFIPKSVIQAVPGNTIEASIILTNGSLVEENWVKNDTSAQG